MNSNDLTPPLEPTGAERRIEERRTLRTNAVVITPGGPEVQVRTIDISRSGMGIVAAANPAAGLRFRIRLTLGRQPQGTAVIEAAVQVMHSVFASQEGGFRIGLRFLSPDPAMVAAIGHYLKS